MSALPGAFCFSHLDNTFSNVSVHLGTTGAQWHAVPVATTNMLCDLACIQDAPQVQTYCLLTPPFKVTQT